MQCDGVIDSSYRFTLRLDHAAVARLELIPVLLLDSFCYSIQ